MANQRTDRENQGGFTEFYLGVLCNSANNFFSTRNKFKISWESAVTSYKTKYEYAQNYQQIANQIVQVFQSFRLYVDHIDLPGITIANGTVIDDGKGSYYVQSDRMITPEKNEMDVYFRDSQISIVDLAYMWMEYNNTPWIRPIKLNLYIDYYSDFDGKTANMAYMVKNCRPIELDTITAYHDRKEIYLRKIGMAFDNIVPADPAGTAKGSSAIRKSWNALIKQLSKGQQETPTIWENVQNSKGFWGTVGSVFTGSPIDSTGGTKTTTTTSNVTNVKEVTAAANQYKTTIAEVNKNFSL